MSEVLCFGDIVRIHEMDRNLSGEGPKEGLVASKGITDLNIYFMRYSDFHEIDDYRQSLFEIIPKNSFEIHNELLKTSLSKSQRENLLLRAKTEEEHFINNYRMYRGKELKFGQEVIFRHLDSGSYLQGTFEAAATVGAFKLELTRTLSSLLLFKLKSSRSYEREGDTIFFEEPLLIYHIKSDCYINYNQQEVYFLDEEVDPWEFDELDPANEISLLRPIVRKNGKGVRRYEVVNQMKPYKLWRMYRHEKASTEPEEEILKLLKPHDIVYLVHTRNKGYLSVDLWKNQVFLKEPSQPRDQHFYEAFWEMVPVEGSEKQLYYLKHLYSGRFLTVEEGLTSSQVSPAITWAHSSPVQRRIILEPTEAGVGELRSSYLVNLAFGGQKVDAVGEYPQTGELGLIVSYCQKNHVKSQLSMVGEMREHSFRIFKLQDSIKHDVMVTISCQEQIAKYVDYIKRGKRDEALWKARRKDLQAKLESRNITLQIENSLKVLLAWIFGKGYEELEGNNDPPLHRSVQIFIESGGSELLVELMYYLGMQSKPLFLLELCYKLLSTSDSEWSKCYLSRFLDLIFDQASVIKKPYIFACLSSLLTNNYPAIDIFMQEDRVKKIVDFALGDTADVKYLRIFRTICVTDRGPTLANQLRILKMFFMADRNRYNVNFRCDFRLKFQDNPEYDELERLGAQKEVLINFPEREPTSLQVFFGNETELWNYFMEYVNLMADCCMGRNIEVVEHMRGLLPLEYILVVLSDPNIRNLNRDIIDSNRQKNTSFISVYEPFVRFAHYAYIDTVRFTPIRVVSKVRYWYEMGEAEDIRTTKTQFIGEKDLEEKKLLKMTMFWVRQFLLKFKQDISNPTDMQLLLTVLQLLRSTVLLGLWDKVSEFKEIIPGIFQNVIKFDSGFVLTFGLQPEALERETLKETAAKNREFIKISKPEINLSIECKTLAVEILLKMMEMEQNIRVTHLMCFLRGIENCTVNTELYNKEIFPAQEHKDEQTLAREETARCTAEEEASNLAALLKDGKVAGQQSSSQERIWINKVAELTPGQADEGNPERFLFELLEKQEYMVMTLMELTDHHNIPLFNSAMNLLNSIFRQREHLMGRFSDVLTVCRGDFFKISKKIKEIRVKLIALSQYEPGSISEERQKELPFPIWKEYDTAIKDEKERTGIIQDLGYLSLICKADVNIRNVQGLMSYYAYDNLGKITSFSVFNECDEPNVLFQTLAAFLDVQNFLVQTLAAVGEPQNELQLKLVHAIFNCLTGIVWNNPKNREAFIQYADVSLRFLVHPVGAADFLKELCKDNQTLLNNVGLVSRVVEGVMSAAVSLRNSDYQKSRLMMVFRSLCLMAGKGHKSNQKLVMCQFQNTRFKELVFVENGENITMDAFREWIQNYKLNYLAALNSFEMEITPELVFVGTLFEIFMAMVESRNLINIGKCRNMHPYLFLMGLMKNCGTCWVVLKALRGYANRLYYLHVEVDVFLFEEFIREEFPLINKELDSLTELFLNQPDFEEVRVLKSARYSYLGSYITSCLEEILVSLKEMLEKPRFFEMLVEWLRKEAKEEGEKAIHDSIFCIGEKVGYLLKVYKKLKSKNKFLMSFLNEVKRQLTEVLKEFKLSYLEDKCGKDVQPDNNEEEDPSGDPIKKKPYDHSKSFFTNLYEVLIVINKRRHREEALSRLKKSGEDRKDDGKLKLIEIVFAGNIELKRRIPRPRIITRERREQREVRVESNLVTSASRYFKILAKPKLNEQEENRVMNELHDSLCDQLIYSPSFAKFRDLEFFKLVHSFSRHDELATAYYKGYCEEHLGVGEFDVAVVPFTSIIKNIFAMNESNPAGISDQNKIAFIKMMRIYITETVESSQDVKLRVDKWEPDYIAGQEEQLSSVQRLMAESGLGAFICTILKEKLDARLDLLNETLLLAIAFLFGGTSECQQEILSYLKADTENKMLVNLNELIKTLGKNVVKLSKIKQPKTLREIQFKVTHEDTYDFYSIKNKCLERNFIYAGDDKKDCQERIDLESALCRSFRFLQLLCEQNNVEMKNFVLVQVNTDGNKKIASINFIETTTFLLRKLFKIMNKKMSRLPLFLLDFINEIAQIPCIDNQICLCKSSFFEDLCYMSSFFSVPANLTVRLFDEEDLPSLYQIYNKSISLVLSNIEGNDNRIFVELINKLELKFLFSIVMRNLLQLVEELNAESGSSYDLASLDGEGIEAILRLESKRGMMFGEHIKNILSVFVILENINDFSQRMLKEATRDVLDPEKKAHYKKANEYYNDFTTVGKVYYPHMEEFRNRFKELLLYIEVATFNNGVNKHQFIYFAKEPVFNFLSSETKDQMMYEVNRETSRDKLTGLISYTNDIFTEIEWNYQLNYFQLWGRKLQINSDSITHLRIQFGFLSLLICFLFSFFVEVDHDLRAKTSYYTHDAFFKLLLIQGLSVLQFAGTLYFITLWLISRTNIALSKAPSPPAYETLPAEEPSGAFAMLLGRVLGVLHKAYSFIRTFVVWQHVEYSLHVVKCLFLYQQDFISILIFLLSSVLGTFYGTQYFTLHAFDFFGRVSIMQSIFSAIRTGAAQLVIVLLLGVVFIYVFSIVTFNTYVVSIYEEEYPASSCESVIQCILTLYTSGVINDSMDEFQLIRFMCDMIYFTFMEVLLGNIISGILIDTFSGLREKKEGIEWDKNNFCFICNKSKSEIEKEGETDFQGHIRIHFLWNYAFYIYCLSKKDKTDYTGIEYDISKKKDEETVDWFPLIEEDGDLESKIKGLEEASTTHSQGIIDNQARSIDSLKGLKI